jgi:hypothetical protein
MEFYRRYSDALGHPQLLKAGFWGAAVFTTLCDVSAARDFAGHLPKAYLEPAWLVREMNLQPGDVPGGNPVVTVEEGLSRCFVTGLLRCDGEDARIDGWERRQPNAPRTAAERKRKQREKQKLSRESRNGVTVTNVTLGEEKRGEEKREDPPSEGAHRAPAAGPDLADRAYAQGVHDGALGVVTPAEVPAIIANARTLAPVASPAARSAANADTDAQSRPPAPIVALAPAQKPGKGRQLGLPGVDDGAEVETGALAAPGPARAALEARPAAAEPPLEASQPAKPAPKERKPSVWQELREEFRAARAKALTGVLPDVELKPAEVNATFARLAAECSAKHGVPLHDAYQAFLVDDYARTRNPPCPLSLFLAQWPKYASAAQRTKAGPPGPLSSKPSHYHDARDSRANRGPGGIREDF